MGSIKVKLVSDAKSLGVLRGNGLRVSILDDKSIRIHTGDNEGVRITNADVVKGLIKRLSEAVKEM